MAARIERGDLLVATASLIDPNFAHTVVLLCEHEPAKGSYGLILNRPIVAPDEVTERLPLAAGRLYQGGPVQIGVVQIMHTFGARIPGALEVVPGLWIGGDWEEIELGFKAGTLAAEDCRFFLGYSGWGEGQLAQEFATNSWIRAPGTAELVLGTEADRLWGAAVRAAGKENPLFANYPDDPSLN